MTPSRPASLRTLLPALALIGLLAACAPRANSPAFSSAEGLAVQRVAEVAFHRMEIGRLETGSYTTNVLVDLNLPQAVRWIVTDFSIDSYTLRFSSDDLAEVAWLVSPRGVQRTLTP